MGVLGKVALDMTSEEPILKFTTHVLGKPVAQKLREGKVMLTVRSRPYTAEFLTRRGKVVPLSLDGQILYRVRLTEITSKQLSALTNFEAELGGFESLQEQFAALKRAGFRFDSLYNYYGFVIQFQRVKGELDSLPKSDINGQCFTP